MIFMGFPYEFRSGGNMTIKKWAAAGMTALALAAGVSVARADSLTLAGGETVNLGQNVNVLDGDKTFFGAQLKDWLQRPSAEASVEKLLREKQVFGEDAPEYKELSRAAVSLLRTAKVYQVRSVADGTYYQGMMASLSLSEEELLQWKQYKDLAADGRKAVIGGADGPTSVYLTSGQVQQEASGAEKKKDAGEAAKESGESGKTEKGLFGGAVQVVSNTSWKEGTSRKGISYRYASARIDAVRNGFAIPLYVEGIIMKEKGRTTFTIFAADQASGKYFAPVLEKALQGAAK